MDEEATTSFWISFFVEAGIPPAASANYAIIFTENRIQKGMLLDLNKEYLKDMGVTVLGDIIAILKHSKLYHEKVAREKVLATDKQLSVVKATKHLNEILLKDEPLKVTQSTTSQNKESVSSVKVTSGPSPPKKLKVNKTEIFKAAQDPEWVEQVEELKRKVIPPSVKLPLKSAVTGAKLVAKKSSVFDRLGESNVTSTTPEVPEPSSATNLKSPSSVFNRLGGLQIAEKPMPTAKSETSAVARLVAKTAAAAAAETSMRKASTPSSSITIPANKMRMDVESESVKQSARQRLGGDTSLKATASSKSTAKIPTKTPIASRLDLGKGGSLKSDKPSTSSTWTSAGVKQRLGSVAVQKSSAASSLPSVFNRLGATRK